MRRKDREVTRHGDLMEMVARFKVCRLGLWDGREVYVVPLNFGYEEKNGSLSLFFHCAREGRKLDILQNRPEVSFEMDGDHVLLEGDAPCRYSYAYGCVMGRGVVEFLREDEEDACLAPHHAAPDGQGCGFYSRHGPFRMCSVS